MLAVPDPEAVTKPPVVTVATAELLVPQTPPPVASVRDTVPPLHKAVEPGVIAAGPVTVTTLLTTQVPIE